MSRTGYDATQATISTTWALTDTLLVVEDAAVYRITGTLLQSLITGTFNPTEKVATKTGAYTIASGDNIINSDTDTAATVIALGVTASANLWDATNLRSQVITINNIGVTDNTTVTPNGSETIQGASSLTIAAGASAQIYTDGSNLFTRAL